MNRSNRRKNAGALCLGYVTLDVVLHAGQVGHAAGGTAANVAANLSFMGWKSWVAAVLGDDESGRQVCADLRESGVEIEHVKPHEDVVTPVVIHEVDEGRHRFRFGCPKCGRRFARFRPLDAMQADEVVAQGFPDVVFIDRVSRSILRILREARRMDRLVMFEPSTLGRPHHFDEAVQLADIVKFSEDRGAAFRTRLRKAPSGQLQIQTRGRRGAQWRLFPQRWRSVPGFPAPVVDAGGAGDWMSAALLFFFFLEGQVSRAAFAPDAIVNALRRAQAVAAMSCGHPGARGLARSSSWADALDAACTLYESATAPILKRNVAQLAGAADAELCPACLSETA